MHLLHKQYELDLSSVKEQDGGLIARINPPAAAASSKSHHLNLRITCLQGSVRVKITENVVRWQPVDLLMASGLQSTAFTVLEKGDSRLPSSIKKLGNEAALLAVSFGHTNTDDNAILVVHASPLKFELYQGDVLQISANDRQLMHYEPKQSDASRRNLLSADDATSASADGQEVDRHGGKEVVDYGEDGLAIYADGTREERKLVEVNHNGGDGDFKESFGGHTDSMPNGPVSVGIDFSFPTAQHVYGIPEHTSPLSLPSTRKGSASIPPKYSQPYRLYNLDVFEYELDETMALYGNIPLMLAHGVVDGKGRTTGVFWFNPSETFVDVYDGASSSGESKTYKESHWVSESGEIDFFFFVGPTPHKVYKQYTALTGTQQLPPMFSLGYHQCRWNYRDEKDVATVESMFEKLDYPVDVIWLDIEHTEGKRYFTWDKNVFPNPIEMQQNVSRHGRRMVTIVDPHIKRDDAWALHREATAKGLYIKKKEGGDYDGWCWPGSSSYLDFTNSGVRDWWADRFSLEKYTGSTMDLFTWNDMNEPSVFNGPEVSMPKDTKNLEGIEHREWHNLYGIYMQSATAQGLVQRSPGGSSDPAVGQRPFVLTRAFWAGSQRFGAMWTGDNTAQWGHLKIAAPMLLSINLAGLSFAGSDVGGFFGEPGAELFTRWYQAGSFTPFFRGHAHHDTKRREPWVFGDAYTDILRKAAMVRYSLLPLWYTAFYTAYSEGLPVMRTMFTEFPDDASTFAMDDQWMIGDSLLVKPVTDAGSTSVDVYLPSATNWFDFSTLQEVASSGVNGAKPQVSAPLDTIPVFIRGGKIVPRKMRLRRSSKLMFYDPYTLVVCPDKTQTAEGILYMDDEITLAHEVSNAFSLRKLSYSRNSQSSTLSSTSANPKGIFKPLSTVERVEIAGQTAAPSRVTVTQGSGGQEIELMSFFDATRGVITIKKPDVGMAEDWSITLHW